MPLTNCARCNRLFNKTTRPVCDACAPLEEEDQARVLRTLESQPNLPIRMLAETAQVSLEVIRRMQEQGMIAGPTNVEEVRCGMCGAPAISAEKQVCAACLARLDREVAQTQAMLREAIGGVRVDTKTTWQVLEEKRKHRT